MRQLSMSTVVEWVHYADYQVGCSRNPLCHQCILVPSNQTKVLSRPIQQGKNIPQQRSEAQTHSSL